MLWQQVYQEFVHNLHFSTKGHNVAED